MNAFQSKEDIPLSKIESFISKRYSVKESGYKNVQDLLLDLDGSIALKSKNINGKKVKTVSLNTFGVEKKGIQKEEVIPLLLTHFEPEKSYPLAQVSLFLTQSGLDYKALGFTKLVRLLKSYKEGIEITGDQNQMVILHKKGAKETNQGEQKETFNSQKKDKESPESNKNSEVKKRKEVAVVQQRAKETPISSKKPKDQKSSKKHPKKINIPEKLLFNAIDQNQLKINSADLKSKILTTYSIAEETGAYTKGDDNNILIPFVIEGKNLLLSFKHSDSKSENAMYMNFIGFNREKPKDYLMNRVKFDDFEKDIQSLAQLAKEEYWCYHNSKDPYLILKIYLQYTFYRLVKQDKVFADEKREYAAFNTGLMTKNFLPIFGVMKVLPEKEKYEFLGFAIAGNQGLGKKLVELFSPLPEKATYIDKLEDYFFDLSCPLHTDYDHIITDNLSRFPLDFLSLMTAGFPKENKIVKKIAAESETYKKEMLYSKLEKEIRSDDTLFFLLKSALEGIITKAKNMVLEDFRKALPSFFPTREVMSIMLPLEFTPGKGPEALLLCEKAKSGNYQGQTILTLNQGYVNARLISSLSSTYLDPKKIED